MGFKEVKAEELTMNPFTKSERNGFLSQREMKKNVIQ